MTAAADERQRWLEERRKSVGASEVAALLGLDPWRGPLAVWAAKVHGEPEISSEVMELGHDLEDGIARAFSRRHPSFILTHPGSTTIKRHPEAPLHATLDRELLDKSDLSVGVLEIKNTSKAFEWIDGVPLRVQCQVQAQLAVTGRRWAYVAALINGRDLVTHRIERDEDDIAAILCAVRDFWPLVEARMEPGAAHPYDLNVVKRLHPDDSGEVLDTDDGVDALVAEWTAARDTLKASEAKADELEAKLRQAIGGATYARLASGYYLTAKTQTRRAKVCACGAVVAQESKSRPLRVGKGPG